MKKRNRETATDNGAASKPPLRTRSMFAKTNRGLLLDIFIFLANLFILRMLTRQVIDLFADVSAENPLARLTLAAIFMAMWLLPALGAVLKRWKFQQRLIAEGRKLDSEYTALSGCLFNPLFYFCLNLVITSFIVAFLGEFLFGRNLSNRGTVFVPLVILGLVLTIVQTYLIYDYFIAPKKPPTIKFLMTAQSEAWGDICLFLNMVLFQIMWNMLAFAPLGRPANFPEFAGRLFFLCFIALLIYFPPRMFYLAEDINRPRTWLTMLLANSPVIIRVLVGTL